MTMLNMCPVCGEGHLTPQVSANTVKIHGQEYNLPCHYAVCNVCECEVADSDDAAENKKLMLDLRQRVEQEMSEKSHDRE